MVAPSPNPFQFSIKNPLIRLWPVGASSDDWLPLTLEIQILQTSVRLCGTQVDLPTNRPKIVSVPAFGFLELGSRGAEDLHPVSDAGLAHLEFSLSKTRQDASRGSRIADRSGGGPSFTVSNSSRRVCWAMYL